MYVSTRLRPSRTDSATSYNALRTFSIIHCESKKLDPFSFEHNFRKYCPILIILSLLQTEIISPQRYDWISHFTYSLLVHYLEKSTAYTFSQKLFNKPAVHAVISLLLQSRKFWWYLLLTSPMLLHDVIMTSYCCRWYAECLVTTLFQQDSAPAHRAAHVRQLNCMLRQETPNFLASKLWPPNSPDLNLVKYEISAVTQHRV